MKKKISQMIETDYHLQSLYMTERPQRIEVFEMKATSEDQPKVKKPSSGSCDSNESGSSNVKSRQAQIQGDQGKYHLSDSAFIFQSNLVIFDATSPR